MMKKLLLGSILVLAAVLSHSQLNTDVEADKAAIMEMNRQWDENALAGNMVANAEQYAKDAVRIGYGTAVVGQRRIRRTFERYDRQLVASKYENTIIDIRISGDLAVAIGTFTGSFTGIESGETTEENGTWADVYQRQPDGSWKSVCTSFAEIREE
jgi:uncharacterized protein (TIGR02246 family)